MPYQNKTRKLNVVKIGPNQLSRYMIFCFNPLSHYLFLKTNCYFATLAFKVQLIVLKLTAFISSKFPKSER